MQKMDKKELMKHVILYHESVLNYLNRLHKDGKFVFKKNRKTTHPDRDKYFQPTGENTDAI